MRIRMTRHAEEEIVRPGIPRELVEAGRTFLLRVVVDDRAEPPAVVTAYRTSKADKYGRSRP